MPFINTKVNVAITEEKRVVLKEKLGKAIECIPGKSESWLMLNFEDKCSMYFKGQDNSPIAFIEVKIFGTAPANVFNNLTGEICKIYNEELNIPKDKIYVQYEEIKYWGWNGNNF